MHELSIAMNILNIVEKTAQTNDATVVKDIYVDMGALAGVMIPSLEFGLEVAKRDTCARQALTGQAAIHIREIEGRGRCPTCGGTFPMGFYIEPCPQCDDSYLSMVAGDELRVREIEVEQAA